MDINNSVALVTGANRGLGRAFAQRLLERGARTVYATARRPETVDLPGVEVLPLDIADPASVRAAAEAAPSPWTCPGSRGCRSTSPIPHP